MGGKGSGEKVGQESQRLAFLQGQGAQQIERAVGPARTQGAGQVTDVLKTGGTGAVIPSIQAAVGGQERATRTAMGQVGEALSRGGAGDEVSQRILSQVGTAGDAAGNLFRQNIVSPVFQQAVSQAFGGAPLSAGAAAGAAGTQLAGLRFIPANTRGASQLGQGLAAAAQFAAQQQQQQRPEQQQRPAEK